MNFLILCLTTLASFGVLFLAAKFIGHKQIAQFDFFGYITGITIGSIAAEMATEAGQTAASAQSPIRPGCISGGLR